MNKLLIYCVAALSLLFIQCGGSAESQLKKMAEEVNSKCPKVIDQWTSLDSCNSLSANSFKYHMTIKDVVITDTTVFKSNLTPQILSAIKISPEMKFFKENNITLIYEYRDQAKNYLFSVIATPNDYK